MQKASKLLAVILLVAACGSAQLPEEKACERFIAMLRADKAAGVPCEVAKNRAYAAEPTCKAVFVCNLRGVDAGAP